MRVAQQAEGQAPAPQRAQSPSAAPAPPLRVAASTAGRDNIAPVQRRPQAELEPLPPGPRKVAYDMEMARLAAREGDGAPLARFADGLPEAPSPQHFSFFGRKEEHGAARLPLFEAERVAAKREELNLLYVAITRARQVFIASGIENARDKGDTPYRQLEAALEKLGGDLVYGADLPAQVQGGPLPATRVAAVADEPMVQVGERRRTPDVAERFGILLHALLEVYFPSWMK